MANPVQIFLSSTCYDLADLRAEVADMLSTNNFAVSMSDDHESNFVVNSKMDSVATCLMNVQNSDAVVCILDRRYGPILPTGHIHAGVSATHAEILHAKQHAVPIFTFIRERSFSEYKQVLSSPDFKANWVRRDTSVYLAKLIQEQVGLVEAAANQRSNWGDLFRTSVDLKPKILKRLLDEFPTHVGSIAMQPERLVRLYFKQGPTLDGGIMGSFRNAGNNPALDIDWGVNDGSGDRVLESQGGLGVGEQTENRRFPCVANAERAHLFCTYANSQGNRFRIDVPLKWVRHSGMSTYEPGGKETMSLWVVPPGEWIPV